MGGDNLSSTNANVGGQGRPQTERSPLWSNMQAYGLAIICLLLGLVVGYLVHGPKTQTAQAPAAQGDSNPHAGMGAQVTPDQLKHMADKKAEPLLAQLKQNPNDPKVLSQLGEIYFATQQFDIAADYYEKSAAAKPDANVLTHAANAWAYANNTDKAIADLERALQVDPKFPNALFNIGMIKWQAKGDTAAAIASWEKLLKTNPNHPNRAQVEQMIAKAKKHMKMDTAAAPSNN